MSFERVSSQTVWETKVSYCRALRAGNLIYLSGTTSLDESGGVHAPGDAEAQARRCLKLIERALVKLGADRTSIVRTRMFVTDISRWTEYGRAHGDFFANCPPTTSMIEVKSLIDPAMLIEIEAEAVVGPG